MLVLISPAKKLDTTGEKSPNFSTPAYTKHSEKLIQRLKELSPMELRKLMGVSDDLAKLNNERYFAWSKKHDLKKCKQAIFAFTGEVYSGLNVASFSEDELAYAQNHLRILSGLYGILKPLDLIHPYRLEMGTKLKIENHTNLYDFWGDTVVNDVHNLMKKNKEEVLVNLASNEYFKVVNKKNLKAKVVTPIFKDFNNGSYKTVMVYAKKARGAMAAFIIKNQLTNKEDLIAFDTDGYVYNKEASTENEFVFYRK